MIGLIDVGGGLRGAFGAGVVDFSLENNLFYDVVVGVSAGSGNWSRYTSGQKGSLMDFYIKYPKRKEYMSLSNYLKTGSFLDLDYIYEDLCAHDGESPVDYKAMVQSKTQFFITATDAQSGKAHYFTKEDMRYDDYSPIKCGSCIPVINKPYQYLGHKYFDGALSDPIPYELLMEKGCDRFIVILTRPKDYRRKDTRDKQLARLIEKSYPKAAHLLANRAHLYNKKLEQVLKLEKQGKALVLAPDSIEGMGTLTKKEKPIRDLYQKGYDQGQSIIDFLSK